MRGDGGGLGVDLIGIWAGWRRGRRWAGVGTGRGRQEIRGAQVERGGAFDNNSPHDLSPAA